VANLSPKIPQININRPKEEAISMLYLNISYAINIYCEKKISPS
jgi:hypothetical protein